MLCELVYAGLTEDFCQKWVFQKGEKKYTEEGKAAEEGGKGKRKERKKELVLLAI